MIRHNAMKKATLTTAAALLMMVFSFIAANAQATATGHIYAEVVDGISASISTSSTVNSNNTINPATFSVNSTIDATFAVTIPAAQTTLTKADGTATMTMSDLIASSQGSKVSLGANLNAGNTTGVYTGSYKVTFDYN